MVKFSWFSRNRRESSNDRARMAHSDALIDGQRRWDVPARILEGIGWPTAPVGETPLEGLPEREMRLAPIDGRPYPVCRSR